MKGRLPIGTSRARARAAVLVFASCWLILSACTAPGSARRSSEPASTSRGAPAWVGQPEGWGKLDEIDRWLQSGAKRYDVYWQLQGELALSEGRLNFVRDEAGTAAAGRSTWNTRLQAARSGFERVLANAEANESQLFRARHGLEELAQLDGSGGATSSDSTAGLISRSAWRAARPNPGRLTRASGGYERITVHHTADVQGALFDGSLRDSTRTVRQVQSEHMDGRGYGDIGYHYLIDPAGRVYQGRDLAYQGAHAGGANNRRNIGVCLLGNFENRRPTSQALSALEGLLAELRREHRIRRENIVGHRELKSTLCPGAHLASWTGDYRRSGPRLSSLGGGTSSAVARKASAPRSRHSLASSASHGTVR